ncbi:MAG: ABC transporter substrate-binding protein, partial [Deltaproteobacteria bacterium]|nr:ABC transporter substrate-binding protein [Deltaproteobacteria bacterium]
MYHRYLRQVILVVFIFFIFLSPVLAGEPTERIREATDRIIDIITDPELKTPERTEDQKRMIREAIDSIFDWTAFSQRALARHWRKRTEEEKREFVSLFRQLLERTYMAKVGDYSDEKAFYLEEVLDGKYGVVKAKVSLHEGREIAVDYRVRNKGGGWLVYDVYVEGVSLVNNYRVQFNEIIT